MKVVVYYQSGMIECFDTDMLIKSNPFEREGASLMTDYQLRLDLLETEGLLLDVYWYNAIVSEANRVSSETATGDMLIHARRQAGRRLRLVSLSELSIISKITCDGEILVWRQGSQLINGNKFFGQELLTFSNATTTSINARALAIFEYLKRANPGLPESVIAEMMGYTKEALDTILADEFANMDDSSHFDDEMNY